VPVSYFHRTTYPTPVAGAPHGWLLLTGLTLDARFNHNKPPVSKLDFPVSYVTTRGDRGVPWISTPIITRLLACSPFYLPVFGATLSLLDHSSVRIKQPYIQANPVYPIGQHTPKSCPVSRATEPSDLSQGRCRSAAWIKTILPCLT